MSDPLVGIYTIGQTPRPDLTDGLAARFGSCQLEVRGLLDGLTHDQVPGCGPGGYPLETRLRDGTRLVVDAGFLEPRLQRAICELDDRVSAHLVLCAGSFLNLTATRDLILPFDVAVAALRDRELNSLEVVVPFAAQAPASNRRWEAAGFSCRVHVLDDRSSGRPVATWLADRLTGTDRDALVFDYVGFPAATLREVSTRVKVPVFELGHLAAEALERALETTVVETRSRS